MIGVWLWSVTIQFAQVFWSVFEVFLPDIKKRANLAPALAMGLSESLPQKINFLVSLLIITMEKVKKMLPILTSVILKHSAAFDSSHSSNANSGYIMVKILLRVVAYCENRNVTNDIKFVHKGSISYKKAEEEMSAEDQ